MNIFCSAGGKCLVRSVPHGGNKHTHRKKTTPQKLACYANRPMLRNCTHAKSSGGHMFVTFVVAALTNDDDDDNDDDNDANHNRISKRLQFFLCSVFVQLYRAVWPGRQVQCTSCTMQTSMSGAREPPTSIELCKLRSAFETCGIVEVRCLKLTRFTRAHHGHTARIESDFN